MMKTLLALILMRVILWT